MTVNTDHVDVPRVAHVICGEPDPTDAAAPWATVPCQRDLWRTYGPAGSLWCPVHGHVVDVTPSPPLTGSVHLNYGGGRGEWIRLEDL